jgi:hypothetical protein
MPASEGAGMTLSLERDGVERACGAAEERPILEASSMPMGRRGELTDIPTTTRETASLALSLLRLGLIWLPG